MDLGHKLLEAVVLGVIQGLTEFLPVSSTAHLRIVPALLGWTDPGAAKTAVIQLGTLVAVLAYFRRDVWQIGFAWFRETLTGQFGRTHDGRMGWMMIVGTVPVAVLGLIFKHQIEEKWRSLYIVAVAMVVVALVMVLAEWVLRRRKDAGRKLTELEDVSMTDAIVVGCAQAAALVPGTSRSGATISGALFHGLSREAAARFSFLLSIPAVFAAAMLELYSERDKLLVSREEVLALIVCTVVSGVVGYAAIAWLLAYLRKRSLYLFVVYRLLLGGLLLGLVATGVVKSDAGLPAPKAAAATTAPR
ncbi:MAG: undecaprenyl-diphosphate phosphatase [Planctomycetes bacterium]|nr:undecaprenyl-diphosphate phosphatase [Planctomycetota bacterium]